MYNLFRFDKMTDGSNCQICNLCKSKYSCPKCNILYCSVSCYQSESHLQCSEDFYLKCVQEELKHEQCDEDVKKKMVEILRQQNVNSDSEYSLDSDDEESTPDLEKRMMKVNLDDVEAVWEKLTSEEQHIFRRLISTGNILKILPMWEPWWKIRKKKTFIQDCQQLIDLKGFCPQVTANIPKLSSLTKAKPSPKVPFMLLNVLISYVFTMRWFKGAHLDMAVEAMSTCIALSAVLRNNQVFANTVEAFQAFENDLFQCPWINSGDYDRSILEEDLVDIVRISGEADDLCYCTKAVLSELILLCTKAVNTLKKDRSRHLKRFSDPPPKVCQIHKISKKIIYYLSWIDMNGILLVDLLSTL